MKILKPGKVPDKRKKSYAKHVNAYLNVTNTNTNTNTNVIMI